MTCVQRYTVCMICKRLRPILTVVATVVTVAIIAMMIIARPVAAQELTFLSGIDDLPLMPGLQEQIDLTLVFDSAEGRYVEAYAEGDVTALAISQFYQQSLPQLGWMHDGLVTYQRDGEILVILSSPSPADSGSATTVRFALSPQGSN